MPMGNITKYFEKLGMGGYDNETAAGCSDNSYYKLEFYLNLF